MLVSSLLKRCVIILLKNNVRGLLCLFAIKISRGSRKGKENSPTLPTNIGVGGK